MIELLLRYIGTIITGLVLLVALAAIVIKMIRDKRNGKCTGCDCGVVECPASSLCRPKK